MSLPSRERGLKLADPGTLEEPKVVAPFAGAWIEIVIMYLCFVKENVAPFAGAWIEMQYWL